MEFYEAGSQAEIWDWMDRLEKAFLRSDLEGLHLFPKERKKIGDISA